MKKLITSSITNSAQLPIKKGTLDFLQLAYQEGFAAIVKSLIGPTYNPGTVYVLRGLVNTGVNPAYNITEGVVFYNGEIFLVDNTAFTLTGLNVAVFNIATTQYTTDADPVTFTDAVPRNIHDIRKVTITGALTGTGIADFNAAYFLSFNIPAQLNLAAATLAPYADNILQVLGSYPNHLLYVPSPNLGHEVLAVGSQNIGDIGVSGFATFNIVFGAPLATAAYTVLGSFVSNGTPEHDATLLWNVKNKTVNGFSLTVREDFAVTQNALFEYVCIKQ
jgi:hypothetical protein